MKPASALAGLAALGGVVLTVAPASAMPAGIGAAASETPYVQQAAYVCNEWGHCWHQHNYSGYDHPHYWRWHRHYGGWDYGGWHHWHHWSQW